MKLFVYKMASDDVIFICSSVELFRKMCRI